MIRETDSLEVGAFTAPFRPGELAPEFRVGPAPQPQGPKETEQEITRLTWSVLDGSASMTDRQRLAELVNAQHALRRRIDR